MAYLDELRKKSGSKKAIEDIELQRAAEREAYYRSDIIPALQRIFGYLSELVEHLNYIEQKIFVHYKLAGFARMKDLLQTNYTLYTDSRQDMKVVSLKFQCKKDEPVKFNVEGAKNVSRVRDYLNTTGLTYRCENVYDRVHVVVNADFTIKSEVNIGFEFRADIDNSCINLSVMHFEGFGGKSRRLKVEDINEKFLDHLARYVTHQAKDFFGLNISEKTIEELKSKVALEKAKREEELRVAELLAQQQELLEKQKSRNSVLDVFKKLKR